MRTPRKNANRHAKYFSEDEGSASPLLDDHKVRYHEEDPSRLQAARVRRPRRHTTGGSQQKDAIEKARQMISKDGEPKARDNSHGTLNRKEFVSLLKTRYGNDIEKYRSLKKKDGIEVEHRNLIENGFVKPKKSSKILTYKSSSTSNGHARKGSISSQESSQESQESLQYPSSPSKYDTLSRQHNHFESKLQSSHNRKVSNGSSVMSDYSSVGNEENVDRSKRIVTTETTTVLTKRVTDDQQPQQQEDSFIFERNRYHGSKAVEGGERSKRENILGDEQQQQQHLDQKQVDRVLFLQYKDEIKRVNMPNSISSLDTVKALFVTSFPGKLSMVRIDERGLIYVKDKEADIFYELEDLRDIEPRALIQLREKSSSYDSLSSSTNEMNSLNSSRPAFEYGYSTMPLRVRRSNDQQQYAESLQDFPIRPRSGSGDSLRSDSFLSRPQRNYSQSTDKVSYVNSGLVPARRANTQIHQDERVTTERSLAESPRIDRNRSGNEGNKPFMTLSEPPKLKQTKSAGNDKKGPTVEEQLADLTRLLHTAMNSDEEDSGISGQDRAPGKLDRNVINNLVQLSEENYSKSPTKGSCYAPTALLEAKKREVENPAEEQQNFGFDSVIYGSEFQKQGSVDDYSKGFMHDGPDVYMKESKQKSEFESGLADSLLKSLQNPAASDSHHPISSSYVRISSTGSQVTSPPATPTRSPSSRIAVQTLKSKAPSQLQQDQYSRSTTTTTRTVDGRLQNRPIQMDKMIGIASSAASLRNSVLTLRSQLDELRLLQTNHSRNFKIFLSQSVQDFNSLAAKVSCDLRTSKESDNSIRDRRYRVQEDYDAYLKRQVNTSKHLGRLEEETELLRREVVQRKRVLEPKHVTSLNSELESLGKSLAELKSRFSGLHDMLKIVMAGELEIIVNEERFLKDEPGNLDNLYARCKHLSGTLFTLQRLASVQQMARSNELPPAQQHQQQHQQHLQHDVNQNRVRVTVNQHSSTAKNERTPEHHTASSRTLRFTQGNNSSYL